MTDDRVHRKRRAVTIFGRSIALLCFVSVIATQIAIRRIHRRVYFPFEHMALPSRGALTRFTRAHKNAVRVSVKRNVVQKARAARRKLELARQEALAHVVVTRYMQWHRRERANPNARKLIWTGHGNRYGLGDRFRGIIHAYLCAVLSDRVLVIKWDEPISLNVIFESAKHARTFFDERLDGADMVDAPACYCSLKGMGILLSKDRVVIHRSESAPSIRSLLAAVRRHPKLPVSQELLTLANSWRARRALRTANGNETKWREYGPRAAANDALFPLIFKALLQPAPRFLYMLTTQRAEVRAFIPTRLHKAHGCDTGPRIKIAEGGRAVVEGDEFGEYDDGKDRVGHMKSSHARHVSVHARLGVGLNESTQYKARFERWANASVHSLAACLAAHATRLADALHHGKPQRFYVATDTDEFTTHFRSEVRLRSPGAVVVGAVQGSVDRVHLNKLNSSSPRDLDRFRLAAADLFFLSAGDAMLSLPSGFANLARWLGDTPHTVLTANRCARERWIGNSTERSWG